MVTPEEARNIIDSIGVTHRKFAKAVGIHYVWLSEWLKNRRLLDAERIKRIDEYCNRLRELIPQ